jgi:hypothetical protein
MLVKNLSQNKKSSAKKLISSARGFDISKEIRDNFVLKNYQLTDKSIDRLQDSILQIIDTKNSGK